jgi:hypothetical protein
MERHFGTGRCILMHPTCSLFHYYGDPNNTPEENDVLLEELQTKLKQNAQ